MRYRVILFDLDGTLIDSGPIIVASMRHASMTVLGLEPDEERVKAAIGGPGLISQMHDLDPDRVDELVEVYRAHNEPLHATLEAFDGVHELMLELRRRGHQLGIVTAKRIVTVEMNDQGIYGFGQLAIILRARYCEPKIESVTKTDGLTFRVKEILDGVFEGRSFAARRIPRQGPAIVHADTAPESVKTLQEVVPQGVG